MSVTLAFPHAQAFLKCHKPGRYLYFSGKPCGITSSLRRVPISLNLCFGMSLDSLVCLFVLQGCTHSVAVVAIHMIHVLHSLTSFL